MVNIINKQQSDKFFFLLFLVLKYYLLNVAFIPPAELFYLIPYLLLLDRLWLFLLEGVCWNRS